MRVSLKTKRMIECPGCNQYEFSVEHLYDGLKKGLTNRFGPWYCNQPDCNVIICGEVFLEDQMEIEINVSHREKPRGLGLLLFRDIYLVVEEHFSMKNDPHADYFYHSHQCPQNLFGYVVAVFDKEGSDPHGILRHIASIDNISDTENALKHVHTLKELFSLFDTDGEPPESEWPAENKGVLDWIVDLRKSNLEN